MAKSCPIVYGPIIVGLAQKSVFSQKANLISNSHIKLEIQDYFHYKKGLFSFTKKSIQKSEKYRILKYSSDIIYFQTLPNFQLEFGIWDHPLKTSTNFRRHLANFAPPPPQFVYLGGLISKSIKKANFFQDLNGKN